jgi:L-fuculose-phosphate aldolase
LHARGLLSGSVGNVSARLGDRVLITPTRVPYARMRPSDIVVVSMDDGSSIGRVPPSRELPLHLAVYRARPDIGAVIHTHSPYATAWSFTDQPLTGDDPLGGPAPVAQLEDLAYYGIGEVGTTPRVEPPGSWSLADAAVETLRSGSAVLLRDHGVLVAAPDLDGAAARVQAVEQQALTAWLLRTSFRHA